MKKCKKCNMEKPLSHFYKANDCKDGHRNTCKKCYLADEKKYRGENPEKLKEKSRKYYKENPEKLKEKSRKYYKENKEKVKEHYLKNKQNNMQNVQLYPNQNTQILQNNTVRNNITENQKNILKVILEVYELTKDEFVNVSISTLIKKSKIPYYTHYLPVLKNENMLITNRRNSYRNSLNYKWNTTRPTYLTAIMLEKKVKDNAAEWDKKIYETRKKTKTLTKAPKIMKAIEDPIRQMTEREILEYNAKEVLENKPKSNNGLSIYKLREEILSRMATLGEMQENDKELVNNLNTQIEALKFELDKEIKANTDLKIESSKVIDTQNTQIDSLKKENKELKVKYNSTQISILWGFIKINK